MWGHHPAYGAPFIGPDTVIDTNARQVTADSALTASTSQLEPGASFPWPSATQHGEAVDLSRYQPRAPASPTWRTSTTSTAKSPGMDSRM